MKDNYFLKKRKRDEQSRRRLCSIIIDMWHPSRCSEQWVSSGCWGVASSLLHLHHVIPPPIHHFPPSPRRHLHVVSPPPASPRHLTPPLPPPPRLTPPTPTPHLAPLSCCFPLLLTISPFSASLSPLSLSPLRPLSPHIFTLLLLLLVSLPSSLSPFSSFHHCAALVPPPPHRLPSSFLFIDPSTPPP